MYEQHMVPTPTVSTLGAPGWSRERVLAQVRAAKMAVELRMWEGEVLSPAMSRAEMVDLGQYFRSFEVPVSSVASYVRVASDEPPAQVVRAGVAALEAAAHLGAPVVRVFMGAPCEPNTPLTNLPVLREAAEVVQERAVRCLDALVARGADLGVLVAVETHDSHPRGADVAPILREVSGPVAAIWDLMHPFRVGESVADTFAHLRDFLPDAAIQIKDANFPAELTPCALGRGTLPLADLAAVLRANPGLTRYVCLESEAAWHEGALEFDVAVADFALWWERVWRGRDA